jgi:hypothetical protein
MKARRRDVISRRLVLRGAGGVAIGLPFLPSVQSRAFAADPVFARLPRFVNLATDHGGVREDAMFPGDGAIRDRSAAVAGHQIGRGPLVRTVDGASAQITPVLRAAANMLTDQIAAKMNILRGLDIPFYIAHHTGGHLGNYARNDGNGSDGKEVSRFPMPTIDQVIGWSPSFYAADLGRIRERAIVTGNRNGFSYNWSNPAARAGTIQEVRGESSSQALFNKVFVPSGTAPMPQPMTPTPTAPARRPIVDRVLEDYRRLRNGNKRLSPGDRQRLDDHLARLAELQRRVGGSSGGGGGGTAPPLPRPMTCDAVRRPTEDASRVGDMARKLQLYNDVIAAAFMCGSSRVAVVAAYDKFVPFAGDWHQDVAHQWSSAGPQKLLIDSNRIFFETVFLDLLQKLDVEEAPGMTFLDNTLVAWTQESGFQSHDSVSIPVVTGGSAAGFLTTGNYHDYRNMQMPFADSAQGGRPSMFHGLTWNRWLSTVLQAMRIPRSEYERPGMAGYGYPFIGADYRSKYPGAVIESANDVLPGLRA